ncbi:helix-turn-helix domain-containing protein [Leptospira paudalimensis]|uniref:Helix-turn-helix domain-containing protein n=1 Tax=Leptospira paudalimensis TaxID=2950024 RepID=A0ABT3M668_9LEPT|nr:helix-turn-helix transcriptional regulator [Leptospira paudalimensis]MCW7503880.1 helix-turn-helix domain-containing protein [Leptospira paudalimensis]
MKFEDFLIKIGSNIRELRLQKGFNQEDLDSGDYPVPVRTLQEIEAGRANLTMKSVYKIAKHLKVQPKDIIDV